MRMHMQRMMKTFGSDVCTVWSGTHARRRTMQLECHEWSDCGASLAYTHTLRIYNEIATYQTEQTHGLMGYLLTHTAGSL